MDAVEALRVIGSKLRKKLDFSVDPCSGDRGWIVAGRSDVPVFADNVTLSPCICSFFSSQLAQEPEFSKPPFLSDLYPTWNYPNGTIPAHWVSLPLVHLSLLGNRVSGTIPEEMGDMITFDDL
ncbi:unnamed protein product [Musa acuminata subsp. malaccensis]|uniref:(wild Malaysian banana) hypothetical protein n=1 Tax=Musa acuminata subsp. malaccensis TaxID=214687 RepID=A0A804ID01_MUSAM|nr:unnamed protein product [Musa acuminata subsp. malaccensis]